MIRFIFKGISYVNLTSKNRRKIFERDFHFKIEGGFNFLGSFFWFDSFLREFLKKFDYISKSKLEGKKFERDFSFKIESKLNFLVKLFFGPIDF